MLGGEAVVLSTESVWTTGSGWATASLGVGVARTRARRLRAGRSWKNFMMLVGWKNMDRSGRQCDVGSEVSETCDVVGSSCTAHHSYIF